MATFAPADMLTRIERLEEQSRNQAVDHGAATAQFKAHISSMQRSLENQTRITTDLHSTIGALREQNKELGERASIQRKIIDELKQELATMRQQILSLTDERAFYVNQTLKYQSMADISERENVNLRTEIAALRAELATRRMEAAALPAESPLGVN